MLDDNNKIRVENLWNVFGRDVERIMQPDWQDLSKSEIQEKTGCVIALKNVNFAVRRGEVYVVMGLSGSGKSTLVRCLIGLINPTRGSIFYDDEDILTYDANQLIEFRRKKVSMVFQHFALLPHRRILDNVAYGLEIQNVSKEIRYQKASEVIETVGLKGWENNYPRQISGGMQQRVGIARALMLNPQVLLMDEPFSGLDPLIRREMQDELISLQTKFHMTIVFITHDLNEALKLGDRIAIMRDGEIVQEGTPEQIVTTPANNYVADFVQDVSRTKVIRINSIMTPPQSVIDESRSTNEAIETINETNTYSAFLVGQDQILKGILTRDELITLSKNPMENLINFSATKIECAHPDSYIDQIIPMAARTEYPIPVIDNQGHLIGQVDRGSLLAGMVKDTDASQNNKLSS